MFWLRGLLLITPFAFALGLGLLHRKVGALRLPAPEEVFTTSIQRPIGPLCPLVHADGPDGEIARLLHEPLLRRGDDGSLLPNLLVSWEERSLLTILCASEEDAGEGEAEVRATAGIGASGGGGGLPGLPLTRLVASERVGPVLSFAFAGPAEGLEAAVLSLLGPDRLADALLVEVRLRHSARDSMRAFLAHSSERPRIGMIDYAGDTGVRLFVRGDPGPLLRELESYYAANASLGPELSQTPGRSHALSRELVLALRPGLRWHDGEAVGAEDLLFSHAALASETGALAAYAEGARAGLREAFDYLESLEAIDPLRLRAVCRDLPADHLESWARLPLLPAHRFDPSDPVAGWAAYLDRPVGCGPYRLTARRSDGGVELEAHDAWHGGWRRDHPPQSPLVYRRMDSLESKLLALRNDRLESLVPDARFAAWAGRHPETVAIREGAARCQHLLAWNRRRAPFDRAAVRLALAQALDHEAFVADAADEFRRPPLRFFDAGLGIDATVLPSHDPDAARAALVAEGLLETADGPPARLRLAYDASLAYHRELASALAAAWRGLGIGVETVAVEGGRLAPRSLAEEDFDAVLLRRGIPKGRDLRAAWGGEVFWPASSIRRPDDDLETDVLIDALRLESDSERAAGHAETLQARLAETLPALPLAETGRIWWFRAGSVAVAVEPGGPPRPPTPVEELGDLAAGPFEGSRPRWVRRRPDAGFEAATADGETPGPATP